MTLSDTCRFDEGRSDLRFERERRPLFFMVLGGKDRDQTQTDDGIPKRDCYGDTDRSLGQIYKNITFGCQLRARFSYFTDNSAAYI